MKLTNDQFVALEGALADAFRQRSELQRVVYYAVEKNLNAISAEDHNLTETIFELITEAEAAGWTTALIQSALRVNPGNASLRDVARILNVAALAPEALFPHELADTSLFDLSDVDHAYYSAVAPAPGKGGKRLLGFGLTYGDEPFLPKLRARLVRHLGADHTEDRPTRALNPRLPADRVIKDLKECRKLLKTKNVLFVVRADQAGDDEISALWNGISAEYQGTLDSFLVVLIVKQSAAAFPPHVVPLPPPAFKYSHVVEWTNKVVSSLRWQPADQWVEKWSAYIYDRTVIDVDQGILDPQYVYECLDDDLKAIRADIEAFRRSLEGS